MDDSFRAFEHDGWQRAAAHYADTFGALTTETVGPLLDAAGVGRGTRLVDVATGPGYAAAAAAAVGADVVAIDFSSSMIAAARRRYAHVDFREGDAEALPLSDRSVDAVVMNFGLLHLGRPDTALAEACRVLVAGGRAAFTVWATPDQAVGFGMVLHAIEAHGRMDVPLPPGPPFFRFSDSSEFARSLAAAGFIDPVARTVPITWRVASGEDLLNAFLRGAVRTAALLRAQSPAALDAIRQTLTDSVGGGCDLPMPAVLASATKP